MRSCKWKYTIILRKVRYYLFTESIRSSKVRSATVHDVPRWTIFLLRIYTIIALNVFRFLYKNSNFQRIVYFQKRSSMFSEWSCFQSGPYSFSQDRILSVRIVYFQSGSYTLARSYTLHDRKIYFSWSYTLPLNQKKKPVSHFSEFCRIRVSRPPYSFERNS